MTPFVAGLSAGIFLVVLLLVAQTFLHRAPKIKARSAVQQGLTSQEHVIAKDATVDPAAAPMVSLAGGPRPDTTPKVGWSSR